MAKEIIVDGVVYRPVVDYGPIKIVVIERGFVYVGRVEVNGNEMTIEGAHSIIHWGTTKHLGELTDGPLKDTKLGAPCTVQVLLRQVIHMIEVNQDGWHKHIDV